MAEGGVITTLTSIIVLLAGAWLALMLVYLVAFLAGHGFTSGAKWAQRRPEISEVQGLRKIHDQNMVQITDAIGRLQKQIDEVSSKVMTRPLPGEKIQ